MKIEQPDWTEMIHPNTVLSHHNIVGILGGWFDTHVEPINKMLAEGVEITGLENLGDTDGANKYFFSSVKANVDTLKAILINIQPIKKDTAKDIINDLVECQIKAKSQNTSYTGAILELVERAKKILGETR